MGAEYLFYMKSIETHARAFLALIILGIGTVCSYLLVPLGGNFKIHTYTAHMHHQICQL